MIKQVFHQEAGRVIKDWDLIISNVVCTSRSKSNKTI
jgi:hypothetical protein